MTALQTILIDGQSIGIKECKGQRVVTFKDIDAVHGRPEGTAHRNFKANKKHFIEGTDFFRRNSSEARSEYSVIAPNGLTLLTESGYLMLVKSFGDDKAWQTQRKLVNSYFHVKTAVTAKNADFPSAPRSFRDISVMTLRDVAQLYGLPSHTISYQIHNERKLKPDADYFILTGDRLRAFKKENPDISRNVSCLQVITKSGLEKLVPVGKPTVTVSTDGAGKETKEEKEECKSQNASQIWRDAPAALRVLKQMYDKYPDEKYRYPLRNSAWVIALCLSNEIYDTGDIMTQFKG